MLSPDNPDGLPPTINSALINDSAVSGKLSFTAGRTYKLRVINMGALAAAMLQFDGHVMRIIEIDGVYTNIKEAQQIRISPAQRYAFLIEALPQNTRNYAFLMSIDANSDYTAVDGTYDLSVSGEIVYDSSNADVTPALVVSDWNPLDDTTLTPLDMQPALSPANNLLTMSFSMGKDSLGIVR